MRKQHMKRLAFALLAVIVAVIVVNDRRHVSRQLDVSAAPSIPVDQDGSLARLKRGIELDTVSTSNPARMDFDTFAAFSTLLENDFPLFHHPPMVRRTGADFGDPDNFSLLYEWQGNDPLLAPILLMAHYDVVPVDPAIRDQWTHPPFSGTIDQEFIWGRGTLDAKNSAIAMMEAATSLIDSGFRPSRTIYFALGHDEETGGTRGNKRIAEWMRSEGFRLEFILDEGGCIVSDFPGLDKNVALIGIAEKGFVNVRLRAQLDQGGHASMPPKQTAIEVLALAIHRLNNNPMPLRLCEASRSMLDYLGPEMSWPTRMAIANRWLFGPLVMQKLGAQESGNAMLRTTFAPTMIHGGVSENVLPTHASATINVRLLPGDSLEKVVQWMKQTISDERVSFVVDESAREASPTSSTESVAFDTLHRSIKEIYPNTLVSPFVLVGGTDSSHFRDIAKDVYRFIPAKLNAQDLKRIHGVDERISKDDYFALIRFYVQLIENATGS